MIDEDMNESVCESISPFAFHSKKNLFQDSKQRKFDQDLMINNFDKKDDVITAQTKLETICKKLEPTFNN